MITDKLLNFVFGIWDWLINLLPTWTDPFDVYNSGFAAGGREIGEWLGALDSWINVGLILTLFGIAFGAKIAVAGFQAAVYLYKLLPGKAT